MHEKSTLQASEVRFSRSIVGIKRSDRIRNCDINCGLGVEPLISTKEIADIFGPMKRMNGDRIPKLAFKYETRRLNRSKGCRERMH